MNVSLGPKVGSGTHNKVNFHYMKFSHFEILKNFQTSISPKWLNRFFQNFIKWKFTLICVPEPIFGHILTFNFFLQMFLLFIPVYLKGIRLPVRGLIFIDRVVGVKNEEQRNSSILLIFHLDSKSSCWITLICEVLKKKEQKWKSNKWLIREGLYSSHHSDLATRRYAC